MTIIQSDFQQIPNPKTTKQGSDFQAHVIMWIRSMTPYSRTLIMDY